MDVGDDRCEMTFMYEYPQFIRVTNYIDKKYPKYGLYAYGEGRLTSRVRSMYFNGIPVLFIPGNAGSYKQVRSLSSVALRKSLSGNTAFHFDYFTVDLNDEFSGLYGPLLYDQLEYVNHSFYRIFELYKDSQKPHSIILIGHSMGGVIAHKLVSQLPDTNMVPVLITLASPLARSPLVLDYHLQTFYDVLNDEASSTTTIINLSGGYKDFLVPTFLTRMKNVLHFNLVTSNIPMMWIQNDHVQILWCKQLILTLTRALFDSVDPKTNFLSNDSLYRDLVFNHHLSHHSGIKVKNFRQYSEVLKLDFRGRWIENLSKQYTIENLRGLRESHWYMVKITPLPGHDILNILALNLDIVNWVYACNANFQRGPARVCREAYQLTHLSEIVPSIKYKRRFIQLNLRQLHKNNSELTHIVFRSLPTNEPVVFHVDIHSQTHRDVTIDLPKWWTTTRQVIFDSTAEKALNLKILIPDLQHVIQYYDLFVEPQRCFKDNHHASITLVSPWADEDRHAFFTSEEKRPFDLRLCSSKPGNYSNVPFVKFILDPACTYKISVKFSVIGTLGQIARFYTPLLLTYVAVVILLALRYQLSSLKQGNWPIIFTAITRGPRGYYLLTLARVFTQPMKSWPANSLPKPDILYIIDDGLDFIILPFFLYVCSVGIVWFLAIVYGISLFTLESTANKVAIKLLTRTFIWSNYFMTFLHKVPAVVAAILVFLSVTTCGSLALCLGTVFYFLRLTQMSQDYVEDVMWFILKRFGGKFWKYFFSKRRDRGSTDIRNSTPSKSTRSREESKAKENSDVNEDSVCNQNQGSSDMTKTGDCEIKNIVTDESQQLGGTHDEDKADIDEIDNINNSDIKKVEKTPEINCKANVTTESSGIQEKTPEDDTTAPEFSDEGEVQETGPRQEGNLSLPSDYNGIFFHSTIFFLWCIVACINIPAVLTWAHNFKFYKTLSPDDSFVPGLTLSLCSFPLWQLEFPRKNAKGLDALGVIITMVILLCLIFATVSLYRLNYLLTFVIVLVTLHQLIVPRGVPAVDESDSKDNKDFVREKNEEIKKKLD